MTARKKKHERMKQIHCKKRKRIKKKIVGIVVEVTTKETEEREKKKSMLLTFILYSGCRTFTAQSEN